MISHDKLRVTKTDEESKRELKRILNDHTKAVNESKGLLTYLFRHILFDLMIDEKKWNRLMKAYLDNPQNRISKRGNKRSSARGNLNKQLVKRNMTIKNFERGLRLLNPKRVIFKLNLVFNFIKTPYLLVLILGLSDKSKPIILNI